MASIELAGLGKTYPNGHAAVAGVDLAIADGELVVLVGPSGCGKSTLLRLIAGLERPTAGAIRFGDRDVTSVRVQDRDVAMVFQSYALYPHRTVRRNLAFALELRRVPRAAITARVDAAARALGIDAVLDRRVAELSGGQRQRVALGRAIVREPAVFLLDEPLSNLDARLRVETRAELARLHRRLGATMVYVTHDQEEAMTLGDRIAVLDRGRIQQCAPPLEVYRRPANRFVAGFVGSPAMNLVPATAARAGAALALSIADAGATLELPWPPDLALPADRAVVVGIRPHDVELAPPDTADASARCDVVEPLGAETLVHLALAGGGTFRLLVAPERAPAVGAVTGFRLRRDRLHLFAAGNGRRIGP
jgi:multiple sugar transport system ATP-binding protein